MTSKEVKKMIADLKEKGKRPERPGKKYLYFAYGSNISISQMAVRCPDSNPLFKRKELLSKALFMR